MSRRAKRMVRVSQAEFARIESYICKGDSFERAFRAALEFHGKSPAPSQLVVVHGLRVVTSPDRPSGRHWHAWNETASGGVVLDFSNGPAIGEVPQIYYDAGHIEEESVWRYTVAEAIELASRRRTYGPWVDGWGQTAGRN